MNVLMCTFMSHCLKQIQAFLCDWGDQEWWTNNHELTIENGKPTMEDHIVNDKQTIRHNEE
jgi:hypothetical protein